VGLSQPKQKLEALTRPHLGCREESLEAILFGKGVLAGFEVRRGSIRDVGRLGPRLLGNAVPANGIGVLPGLEGGVASLLVAFCTLAAVGIRLFRSSGGTAWQRGVARWLFLLFLLFLTLIIGTPYWELNSRRVGKELAPAGRQQQSQFNIHVAANTGH